MSGIASELVDSSPADRPLAFDILVREEPDDDEDEDEDEEDDGEDEDEGEDDGNSDGYSE
jgi:hypothetical protein